MPSRTRKRSVVAAFVMPLAGLLTLVFARFFDIGGIAMELDEETSPLQNERDSPMIEMSTTWSTTLP